LAFPKTDWWILSWTDLIPLLLVLDQKNKGRAFLSAYLTGVIFFWGVLYWLIHVTVLGATLLIFYLSVYFGLFGIFYSAFAKETITKKLFLLPAAWVSLEFLRAHLLTGFGWAALGHSQSKNLMMIQIADITGVYGISFLIVMVNLFLKEYLKEIWSGQVINVMVFKNSGGVITTVVFLVYFAYGCFTFGFNMFLFGKPRKAAVGVVQGNIEQDLKWESQEWPDIFQKYLKLTKEASSRHPEIIIWPETSFPGYVWEAPELFEELKEFVAKIKIPILVGLVRLVYDDYFNSAVLVSSNGHVIKEHDKMRLVPFGEYIPLRNWLPFLEAIVPIGDFTPGKRYTLFPINPDGRKKGTFGVLICFEDTIPEISRRFVQEGADFLVNITNDAWFKDTKAPYLHMQNSVFRTIENRRSLVRSANTGVSCMINSFGKIVNFVQDKQKKKTYVEGIMFDYVPLGETDTFYTKFGDIFTYLCFGGILWGMIRRG